MSARVIVRPLYLGFWARSGGKRRWALVCALFAMAYVSSLPLPYSGCTLIDILYRRPLERQPGLYNSAV